MGTTTIDVVQSAQITELQDDVVALKDEINKIVAEITSLVTATNTLKSNVEDIDERITANYTNPTTNGSGSTGDGILERLKDVEKYVAESSGNNYSPPAPETYTDTNSIDSTTQDAVSSQSQTSATVSVTGVYTVTGTKVLTIEDDAATRAREVARSSLTKLRDL